MSDLETIMVLDAEVLHNRYHRTNLPATEPLTGITIVATTSSYKEYSYSDDANAIVISYNGRLYMNASETDSYSDEQVFAGWREATKQNPEFDYAFT